MNSVREIKCDECGAGVDESHYGFHAWVVEDIEEEGQN